MCHFGMETLSLNICCPLICVASLLTWVPSIAAGTVGVHSSLILLPITPPHRPANVHKKIKKCSFVWHASCFNPRWSVKWLVHVRNCSWWILICTMFYRDVRDFCQLHCWTKPTTTRVKGQRENFAWKHSVRLRRHTRLPTSYTHTRLSPAKFADNWAAIPRLLVFDDSLPHLLPSQVVLVGLHRS
jgi:hypothetical protein